jgi:hypothetical protein
VEHKPEKITIHCSATKNGVMVRADEIRKWHKAKGWTDIGYHLVIQPSGECERGRGYNHVGAHVKGHNTGNIGICLIGYDRFDMRQLDALKSNVDSIMMTYDIEWGDIYCHYEFDTAKRVGKECPNIRATDLVLWLLTQDDRLIRKYTI